MSRHLKYVLAFSFLILSLLSRASSILMPMDEAQKDHLKAYGVAFWVLKNGGEVDWLLNYRGGSFMTKYDIKAENECKIRGVSYEIVPDGKVAQIVAQINDPSVNMDLVKLEKAPRMAVYSPRNKGPLEDAVVLVLNYAEIPFDYVYDEEVLKGELPKYDWLHLHHEDFTGQYSKFNGGLLGGMTVKSNPFNSTSGSIASNQNWYVEDRKTQEARAHRLGFKKVSKMKLAVAQNIRDFCAGGGFLFAMCSGADSFDIALAAANTDICDTKYDGDGIDPKAQSKLDFSQTVAFQNFTVALNPFARNYSDIDVGHSRAVDRAHDFFTLFEFSAKWDVVPSMLTQDHERVIKGFMGLATAFNKDKLKPGVTILGELKTANEARYIHGEYGKGQWTFYGGHDPEDYQHSFTEAPTDLSLHPNSPGYRLILNNVLFPAAKKRKQKT
jgi:hypothetical protein